MTPTLLHLDVSPWSERARWALDLRGVAVRHQRYTPLLGEARLWFLRRKASGPLSVPVLITDEGVITDSTEIARWADARGQGPRLFPPERADEIQRWLLVSDRALDAGRVLALHRMLQSPDALDEQVPAALRWLGPIARSVATVGVRRILQKYGGAARAETEARSTLNAALDEIRVGLAAATSSDEPVRTLLGQLSYADLCATQALTFVQPPDAGLVLGPASRSVYTDPELARHHADLVAWRDSVYARWRVVSGLSRAGILG